MSVPIDASPETDRELVLCRRLAATPAQVYRAWTEPELLKRWFAPLPYVTVTAEMDVRPGGISLIVMRAPDGTEMPGRGVYLEVVPNRRLVFTDAYRDAWQPSEKPFMTVVLTFEAEAGDAGEHGHTTRYTARVRHWTVADRERHEAMGFHTGWGICADQLEAVAARL